MPDYRERQETAAALHRRTGQLAVQTVREDESAAGAAASAGCGLAAALAGIAAEAEEAGLEGAARIARDLAASGLSASDVAEGIARLQQALEDAARMSPQDDETERQAAAGQPQNPLAQDPELLADFVLESKEHLASIEAQLLILEHDPVNSGAINSVFRGFHTIKGLAGFLELSAIQQVAHEVETLLSLARDGKLAVTPGLIDVTLSGADYLKRAIQAFGTGAPAGASPPAEDNAELLARIRRFADAPNAMEGQPDVPAAAPALEQVQIASPAASGEATAVKVGTAKLDYLVDMVGEMVIAQTLVRHDPDLTGVLTPRLSGRLSQLARMTAEVQKAAMSMRMIPVGRQFRRMARLVRDLSRKSGKQVELETEGEETELDRTLVEELADPLMHMVRNAVDHGIEAPEERLKSGKPATGRVRLRASHQAGYIIIEVSDDGRGLDAEKILAKARRRGLVQGAQNLSDQEIHNLIFLPGFSTADTVTSVSGRGVGMDVVRTHVQRLRGRIDIRSVPGQGSTFLLKLPLTLAIVDGLVVGVGKERYIVPIFAVTETLRPAPGMIISIQGCSEIANIRGRLLPMVRLYRRFGLAPRSEDPCEGLLVVCEAENTRYCLLVDELIGKQEVVIKSLGEGLGRIPGLAGGAILGDGKVGLILDVNGIFSGAGDA